MAEPTNITTNVAGIYSADLLYEQNGKCGTTIVLTDAGTWASADQRIWKIVVLTPTTFGALAANNIPSAACTKLESIAYTAGQELLGDFTQIEVTTGDIIGYADCTQS